MKVAKWGNSLAVRLPAAVVEALQALPEDVLENLFKPMLMKARPGAAEAAKGYAKKPAELLEMLKSLRIKNYIR